MHNAYDFNGAEFDAEEKYVGMNKDRTQTGHDLVTRSPGQGTLPHSLAGFHDVLEHSICDFARGHIGKIMPDLTKVSLGRRRPN